MATMRGDEVEACDGGGGGGARYMRWWREMEAQGGKVEARDGGGGGGARWRHHRELGGTEGEGCRLPGEREEGRERKRR